MYKVEFRGCELSTGGKIVNTGAKGMIKIQKILEISLFYSP